MPFSPTGKNDLVVAAARDLVIQSDIAARIEELRKLDPWTILGNIDSVASDVIQAWRLSRKAAGTPAVREATVAQYAETARMLEEKYSRERGVEFGELSPVETLQYLFKHSRRLRTDSFKTYRSAMLFKFNEDVVSFESRNEGVADDSRNEGAADESRNEEAAYYASCRRALATLIVVQRVPHQAAAEGSKPASRAKSLARGRYEKLVKSLGRRRTRKAQAFVSATLLTGLRPGEWANATLRRPTASDMPADVIPSNWWVLDIKTSKQKGDRDCETRTLLFPADDDHDVIFAHMENFTIAMAKTATKGGRRLVSAGDKLFIKQSSEVIKEACKGLWPKRPELWATLYTLRSQARANFTRRYGAEIAAAMLGHAVRTGQSHYASKRLGAVAHDGLQTSPTKETLERALRLKPARARPDIGEADRDQEQDQDQDQEQDQELDEDIPDEDGPSY